MRSEQDGPRKKIFAENSCSRDAAIAVGCPTLASYTVVAHKQPLRIVRVLDAEQPCVVLVTPEALLKLCSMQRRQHTSETKGLVAPKTQYGCKMQGRTRIKVICLIPVRPRIDVARVVEIREYIPHDTLDFFQLGLELWNARQPALEALPRTGYQATGTRDNRPPTHV